MKALYEKYKPFVLFGAIAVVVVAGFLFFFGGDEEPALVSQGGGTAASAQVGRDLLDQLLRLRTIQLNEQIFSDPSFRRLEDFGQAIPPQPVGRRNPFAPL